MKYSSVVPDVAVAGELAHLVHLRPVTDGVADGGHPQQVDADAADAESRRLEPGGATVFLHEPPRGPAVEITPDQRLPVCALRPGWRQFWAIAD
jgi:hypothetical protein